MSKILGYYDGKVLNPKLKQLNFKDLQNIYLRIICDECNADYVISFKEMVLLNEGDGLGEGEFKNCGIYMIKCPSCGFEYNVFINELFLAEHWCDEDGNYILKKGELYYFDGRLTRALFSYRPEPVYKKTEIVSENKKDPLDEREKYDEITSKDIPKTEEFKKHFEQHSGLFRMTKEEYLSLQNFYKEHHNCMINPATGMHRFGAIGGGMYVSYHIGNYKDRIHAHCEYCHTDKPLPYYTNSCLTDEELVKYSKKYDNDYYPSQMNELEYYRFLKFCETRKNDDISVSFMGTGLGSLVKVKDETTGVYADITDIDSW